MAVTTDPVVYFMGDFHTEFITQKLHNRNGMRGIAKDKSPFVLKLSISAVLANHGTPLGELRPSSEKR